MPNKMYVSRFQFLLGKRVLAVVAGALFFFDQTMKFVLSDSFQAYCNEGGSWGISIDNNLIVVAMTVILVLVAYLFLISKETILTLALAFIFVGGLSNFSDRMFFGCVRDFLFVDWFFAFNGADISISVGVLCLSFWLYENKNPTP